MKNGLLSTILAGTLVLPSCAPQKDLSQNSAYQDPCQNEWVEGIYPQKQEGFAEGNISGTKRSQIKGESQSWETFNAFGVDYYARKDITAKNPIGFDLTKKDLVAIAYSPVTGKTEAFPLVIYHPVQIINSDGKPHKELTIENIALKDPKFSGCKINENKINFGDYKIETTVINKQTYLLVQPQAEIDESKRLPLYIIPLTPDVLLVQDPQAGKLKITSTDGTLEAYKLINEASMHPEHPTTNQDLNVKNVESVSNPIKVSTISEKKPVNLKK